MSDIGTEAVAGTRTVIVAGLSQLYRQMVAVPATKNTRSAAECGAILPDIPAARGIIRFILVLFCHFGASARSHDLAIARHIAPSFCRRYCFIDSATTTAGRGRRKKPAIRSEAAFTIKSVVLRRSARDGDRIRIIRRRSVAAVRTESARKVPANLRWEDSTSLLCRAIPQFLVPVAPEIWIGIRQQRMDYGLNRLAKAVKDGTLPNGVIENGELRAERLKSDVPGDGGKVVLDLYKRLPEVRIPDLLLDVDKATGFTDAFTHLRTGEPCNDIIGLLNMILAEGLNLGPRKMAEMELTFIRNRHRAGIDAAKKKGVYKGCPKQVDAERIRELPAERIAKAQIARDLKISRMTV